MKASFTLRSAIDKAPVIVALITTALWVMYPTAVKADNGLQSSGEQALVFEVKILPAASVATDENTDQNLSNQTRVQLTSLSYADVANNDPLVKNLRAYLERHNSPLAQYADQIVLQPQWQRALAISWGESNFAIHCHSNNCSGIGGSPSSKSWRRYNTKLDWFKDMAALMETPRYKLQYTNCRTMNGVYNAGSANWLRACEQKSNELISLTQQSEQERLAMVNNRNTVVAATAELTLK